MKLRYVIAASMTSMFALPSTWWVLLSGVAGLGLFARRGTKGAAASAVV
jgi:hypothetical protein